MKGFRVYSEKVLFVESKHSRDHVSICNPTTFDDSVLTDLERIL